MSYVHEIRREMGNEEVRLYKEDDRRQRERKLLLQGMSKLQSYCIQLSISIEDYCPPWST